jgi:hypothetical protein
VLEGQTAVNGTGTPDAAIQLCNAAVAPAVPTPLCLPSAAVPLASPVTVAADGTFSAAVAVRSPFKAGNFVYITEISAVGATQNSPVITVGAATATTLNLIVDPTTIDSQQTATITAVVVPGTAQTSDETGVANGRIDGTVQFFWDKVPFGAPVGVKADGMAIYKIGPGNSMTKSPGGTSHSITAVFTPKGSPYASSTSSATSITASSLPLNDREHTDFVGGILFAADGSNYSQGNSFLAMNYDRAVWNQRKYPAAPSRLPGGNTFFQARLTSIPVNTNQTTQSSTGTNSTSTGTGSSGSSTTISTSSFLSAQKTAQFSGGLYLPWLFGQVPRFKPLAKKEQTFFLAPVARFGFSTPASSAGNSSTTTNADPSTGQTTTTTTTPTLLGTTSTATGQLYNFWFAGGRIGTAELQPGSMKVIHYFDIGVGKFNNLQSLVCLPGTQTASAASGSSGSTTNTLNTTTTTTVTTYADGTCQQVVTATNTNPVGTTVNTITGPLAENRTTSLRLAFEGYMEVQTTTNSSLILGISANYGPGIFPHHSNLDTNNRAKDDLEFLFGYKFDVSNLLSAIPVIGH